VTALAQYRNAQTPQEAAAAKKTFLGLVSKDQNAEEVFKKWQEAFEKAERIVGASGN